MARKPARGAVPKRGRKRSAPAPELSRGTTAERMRSGRPPSAPVLYLLRHLQAARDALQRFRQTPVQSLLTAAVLGVALALPAAFLVVLDNAERIAGQWEGGTPEISLFYSASAYADADNPDEWLSERARAIGNQGGVAAVRTITPDEALEQLRGFGDLDDTLAVLDRNPLPPVVVAYAADGMDPADVRALAEQLAGADGIEQMRLDQEWIERLHALMQLLERAVWFVAALLALAVVLTVGNTVRMTIENRRQEIEILKLIGGSNGFVRRPFLYEGAWFGLVGGAGAWALTEGGRALLAEPADALAVLYDSPFELAGPGITGGAALLGTGALLGLIGAWVAVGRHLAAIEPR